jgi:hypothetical protein
MELRKVYRALALLTPVVACSALALPGQQEGVYLFDCSGRIQRVDGNGMVVTPASHVADIDSTLPHQVRDGCSVHSGWQDSDNDRLVLTVQTKPWQDEHDSLPTKLLIVTTPGLMPRATEGPLQRPPERPYSPAIMTSLQAIESPFLRNAGYLLSDGTTLLLQELAIAAPSPRHIQLNPLWQSGRVSLNRGYPNATGRYALVDVATREQRGVVVSAVGIEDNDRVVCFTPSGRIFLAGTRHTLVVLDVTEPSQRSTVNDLTVDLYWTACAWD